MQDVTLNKYGLSKRNDEKAPFFPFHFLQCLIFSSLIRKSILSFAHCFLMLFFHVATKAQLNISKIRIGVNVYIKMVIINEIFCDHFSIHHCVK